MPIAKLRQSTPNPIGVLRARLSAVGVKRRFLNEVILPEWWQDTLAGSKAGMREVAGYICARIGFNLTALLDAERTLTFADPGIVKYKKAAGVAESEVLLATHYALGIARAVAGAFAERAVASDVPQPEEWRQALLAQSDRPWVCLRHILKASWDLGIPVIQVRNSPPKARKPDALTTMVGDRPVIVILSASKSPSWIAFIVAHELGHIHRGHLPPGQTLVDDKIAQQDGDKDETEANEFASLLLTGHTDLGLHTSRRLTIPQLVASVRKFGTSYHIAPGVAALNYGGYLGSRAMIHDLLQRCRCGGKACGPADFCRCSPNC